MVQLYDAIAANGYFRLVPWVVFFPVIGLLINILLGGRLKEKLIGAIASLAVAASFGVAGIINLRPHPKARGSDNPYPGLDRHW